jgi:hypothetical protein
MLRAMKKATKDLDIIQAEKYCNEIQGMKSKIQLFLIKK